MRTRSLPEGDWHKKTKEEWQSFWVSGGRAGAGRLRRSLLPSGCSLRSNNLTPLRGHQGAPPHQFALHRERKALA